MRSGLVAIPRTPGALTMWKSLILLLLAAGPMAIFIPVDRL
jgi:hypothetical protein